MLRGLTVQNVVISYDIACKWSIHHLKRISNNHPDLNVENLQLSYLVPKFHLPAHGSLCQTDYSFNYAKGVGRTHGETVEHGWANTNLAALSTREMGPGAHHLTLDDTWSGWNWGMILGMGKPAFQPCLAQPLMTFSGELLLQNLLKAFFMKEKHTSENEKFDPMFSPALHEDWIAMIQDWECNRLKPSPFIHVEKGTLVCMLQFFMDSRLPSQ